MTTGKKDDAIAVQVTQNWATIEKLVADHPYSLNWGPVRHRTPLMSGLHPDFPPVKT